MLPGHPLAASTLLPRHQPPDLMRKAQLLCTLVRNGISETEFWVTWKRRALLRCQAKGDTVGSCLRKLCVPTQEDLMRSFMTILPKGGVADKGRVCAGSQVVALRILMSLSGPFNFASGGFLAAPPLISNCSTLPFGTQGRSWRLESCLQEMGDQKKEASMPRSFPGPHPVSHCGRGPWWWMGRSAPPRTPTSSCSD